MLEFEEQYPCNYIAGNTTTMQHVYFSQPIPPQLLDLLLALIDHCQRFPQEPLSSSSFIHSFFQTPCPGLQSEYYLDDELVGVGFLDQSDKALSSVYFIFKKQYQKYRLGVFSVLKEIEYCNDLGLKYYYLGYYIKENQRMAYKDQFKPNLKMDWSNFEWQEHRIDDGS